MNLQSKLHDESFRGLTIALQLMPRQKARAPEETRPKELGYEDATVKVKEMCPVCARVIVFPLAAAFLGFDLHVISTQGQGGPLS